MMEESLLPVNMCWSSGVSASDVTDSLWPLKNLMDSNGGSEYWEEEKREEEEERVRVIKISDKIIVIIVNTWSAIALCIFPDFSN